MGLRKRRPFYSQVVAEGHDENSFAPLRNAKICRVDAVDIDGIAIVVG